MINKFSRSDFKFVADRLIRMVIEEGLNQLPYTEVEVTTPTGDFIFHHIHSNMLNLLGKLIF